MLGFLSFPVLPLCSATMTTISQGMWAQPRLNMFLGMWVWVLSHRVAMAAPGEVGSTLTHLTSCLSFCHAGVLYKVQSGSMWCMNTEVPVETQGKEARGAPPKKGRGAAPSVLLAYEQNHLSGPRKLKAAPEPPLCKKKTQPMLLHTHGCRHLAAA